MLRGPSEQSRRAGGPPPGMPLRQQ
jgi:hypothetical protein